MRNGRGVINVQAFQPPTVSFQEEVIQGLQGKQKQLSPKYFYDVKGAFLFDQITNTKEYYPTWAELSILNGYGNDIAGVLGEGCRLIEFGSGSSRKTKNLLDRAYDLHSYVPIDISVPYLSQSVEELAEEYPALTIQGICADYTEPIVLPEATGYTKNVVFFPGSSFGNFEQVEGELFLSRTAALLEEGDGMLIGIDLKKDPRILHAAYNDKKGVTAAFNKNLLSRINREVKGDFDLSSFEHYAFYQPAVGRIEMHLISKKEQTVQVGAERIIFHEGESIHTENSYKFTMETFTQTAEANGFTFVKGWTDPNDYFAVLYFQVET